MKCEFCEHTWEPTKNDEYVLRCGFCERITCEKCGTHDNANIHCCPECKAKHSLEDIWVSSCDECL